MKSKIIATAFGVLSLMFVFSLTSTVYASQRDMVYGAVEVVTVEDNETITHYHVDANGDILAMEVVFVNAERELAAARDLAVRGLVESGDARIIPDQPSRGKWIGNCTFMPSRPTTWNVELDFDFYPSLGGNNAAFTRMWISRTVAGGANSVNSGRDGRTAVLNAEFPAQNGWLAQSGRINFTVNGAGIVSRTLTPSDQWSVR